LRGCWIRSTGDIETNIEHRTANIDIRSSDRILTFKSPKSNLEGRTSSVRRVLRRVDLNSFFTFLFLAPSANPREARQVADEVLGSRSYGLAWMSGQGECDDEENEAQVEESGSLQRLRG
jgi:hypothetical protein